MDKPIPEAVRAWLNAEGKFREAVETYNDRLRLVRAERERGNWSGGGADPEYQAMEEARHASATSLRAMYDTLTAAQQQGQAVAALTTVRFLDGGVVQMDRSDYNHLIAAPPSAPVGVEGLRHEAVDALRDAWKLGRRNRFLDSAPLVERIVKAAIAQRPEAHLQIREAPAAQQVVMPEQPTPEMVEAFRKAHDEHAALRIPKVYARDQREEQNIIVGYRAMREVLLRPSMSLGSYMRLLGRPIWLPLCDRRSGS